MRPVIALLLLAAAGCAHTPPPPPPPPPAAVAPAVPTIDGLWQGSSTRFLAENRSCPSPGLILVDVLQGRFEYHINRTVSGIVTIAPDGTLAGQAGEFAISGRLAGTRMSGDAVTDACGLHFTLTKRG